MKKQGLIQKMHTKLISEKVHYTLPIGNELIEMNALIGKQITLTFNEKIICSNCGNTTKKSYSQGFCYPCCQALARCDLCIMKPETCHYHLNTCREPSWGLKNCFAPHTIYLANSSGVKVGITRNSNLPHRWIDQGAVAALPILQVDTRLKSGQIEHALKPFVADKTNWQKMLKNEVEPVDLTLKRNELLKHINREIAQTKAVILNEKILKINYSVLEYPTKIISLNFDKTPIITGNLRGIKGQYLLLDTGVLNIRKFSAYHLTLEVSE
jgi:hypothetical protein